MIAVSNAAYASDKRVYGAKQCTAYIPSMERQYGIPSHLLSAISSTETGRYHDRLKIALPWPWTINVEGKGYYFDTKREAIAAVRKHQAAGKRSIDIGCMQVNLVHHANAFASLERAFDPKYNIQYAASFLRRLYESEKSWRKAAAAYHSKTPKRGSQYVARVFRAWEKIVNRLRLSPRDTLRMADARFDGRDMIKGNQASKPVRLARAQANKSTPKHEPMKMKVIKVADARHQGDVMLIKPDVAESSAAKAYKDQPLLLRVDKPATSKQKNMHVVRLDKKPTDSGVTIAAAEKPAAQKTGPRFIFTD